MKRKDTVLDMVKTGQNLKRIMQLKGYTVKDIQEHLKLSTPQAIYHWFDGMTMPTLDNMYALSELFRMPVDAIVRGNRKFVYVPFNDRLCIRIYTYYEKIIQLQVA